MEGRLPDFIIIGAMKCGTSTLHEQLALRSGLFMSTPKEPNFFSDDEQFQRGINAYASLFANARDEQLCGESSTHYTKLPTHPHALDRMQRVLREVKLIYMMRDPLERIVSQYIHEWSLREVRGPFEAAVLQHERFVAYSCFARQLRPYLQTYGADFVLPVFFERMLAYPDAEFARVCEFIGDRTPSAPRWEDRLIPQNVSSERMRKSAVINAVREVPILRALKDRIPQTLREPIKAFWRMRKRPEISPELRAELEARIDPDLIELGTWLGCELRCQGWRERVLSRRLEWRAPPDAAMREQRDSE